MFGSLERPSGSERKLKEIYERYRRQAHSGETVTNDTLRNDWSEMVQELLKAADYEKLADDWNQLSHLEKFLITTDTPYSFEEFKASPE